MKIQNGKCKICGINQKELPIALAVDHDHKTGIFRGLVCKRCNANLGWLDNNFISVKEYLDL